MRTNHSDSTGSFVLKVHGEMCLDCVFLYVVFQKELEEVKKRNQALCMILSKGECKQCSNGGLAAVVLFPIQSAPKLTYSNR